MYLATSSAPSHDVILGATNITLTYQSEVDKKAGILASLW